MAKASQSQLYNNLDERLYNHERPFKDDIVNTREVYEFLRNEDRDKETPIGQKPTSQLLENIFS